MNNRGLLRTGIVGSVICAVGCVTPIFVIALGAIGLSAMTAYLDYVLFSGLAVFLGLTGYALYLRARTPQAETAADTTDPAT